MYQAHIIHCLPHAPQVTLAERNKARVQATMLRNQQTNPQPLAPQVVEVYANAGGAS